MFKKFTLINLVTHQHRSCDPDSVLKKKHLGFWTGEFSCFSHNRTRM